MRFSLALFAVSACAFAAAPPDVVVYGGTAAGVMAAIQVSRMGGHVLLVAPEKHIGGVSVEGLGGADINNHWFRNDVAVGGLAREFYQRVGRHYGSDQPVYRFEPHIAEQVFDELLSEAKVPLLREQRLREPLRKSVQWCAEKRSVCAITTESGQRVEGGVFIDASIEGDLLAAAGVSTTVGRESNAQYGETKNGIRGETTHAQFQVRVDPYRIPGDASSGVIPTIQDEPLGEPGAADHRIQAYCFRLCLTRDPGNAIPITKPAGFNRADYEIYLRYLRAGGTLWSPVATLPNGKTDLGSWHDLSANLYGMNDGWPEGTSAERKRIYGDHLRFTQGLLWLLAHDPEIPTELRQRWAGWGLCRDEFADNGGWPRQLYVRDARRMVSDYVITEQHTRRVNPVPVEDPVAVAYWPTDTHSVRRIIRDGAAYNEGFVFDDNNWGPFGISYRSMTPRRREALNVLTATCVSSSHVAYGAIRLEQTFMSLGQAAGTAALLAARHGQAVQEISYPELRARLVSDGQVIALALPQPKKAGVEKDRE